MDPMAITQMLSAGALAAAGAGAAAGLTEVVKTGIVDAYAGCKRAVRAAFGTDEDAKEKLGQLEVKPEDPGLQQALASYLESHRVFEDPAVVQAVEALRVQLTRVEGGVGSISTGAVIGNTLRADRGGIAGVNISGGASTSYTAPGGAGDPS